MDNSLEALKYTFPLFGVVIGWILSQLSERNKLAREDRRKLKRTIFYLLEVRHQLGIISMHDIDIDTYIDIIKKKFHRVFDVNALDSSQFKEFLLTFVKGMIGDKPLISNQELENLNNNFNKCIDTLAEIDPIVAFRLQGRQNVREMVKDLSMRSQASITEITNNVKDVEELKNVFTKIEPNIFKKTISDLDYILLQLAKEVDRKTFKQTKARLTHRKSAKDIAEMEAFVDSMLTGMIPVERQESTGK